LSSCGSKLVNLVMYLLESTLWQCSWLTTEPSLLAASAISLALKILGFPTWNFLLSLFSNYTQQDLQACIQKLEKCKVSASQFMFLKTKYSQPEREGVAILFQVYQDNKGVMK